MAKTGVASDSRRASAASRSNSVASASTGMVLPMKQMEIFLRRQSLVTKDRARKEFAQTTVINGIQVQSKNIRSLRLRLFLIYFVRALITNTVSFVSLDSNLVVRFHLFDLCDRVSSNGSYRSWNDGLQGYLRDHLGIWCCGFVIGPSECRFEFLLYSVSSK